MAHYGTKGFFVSQLRALGVTKHPTEQRKLKLYKTHVVRNLYLQKLEEIEASKNA